MKITVHIDSEHWIGIRSIDKPEVIEGKHIPDGFELQVFGPRGQRSYGETMSRFQLTNLRNEIGMLLGQCKHGATSDEECQACEE